MRAQHFGVHVVTAEGLQPVGDGMYLGQAVDMARDCKDLQPALSVHVTFMKDGKVKSLLELKDVE